MKLKKLTNDLNAYLNIFDFKDYGPNGLQVEGKEDLEKIAFSVSATKEAIEQSIAWGADSLIVHHGIFWNYQKKTLTKQFYKRVAPLIKNDVSLLAYHLPLDAHLGVGNAKAVADLLGMNSLMPFGDYKGMPLGVHGLFSKPVSAKSLEEKCKKVFSKDIVLASPNKESMISSMGIITGGANNEWVEASKLGLDAYLTGEISEYNWHDAIEANVHYFACGHHATEKFGIQELMKKVESDYNVSVKFFDSANLA